MYYVLVLQLSYNRYIYTMYIFILLIGRHGFEYSTMYIAMIQMYYIGIDY